MKKTFRFFGFVLTLLILLSSQYYKSAFAGQSVYLGGMTAGFSLNTRGVQVVGFCDVLTKNGAVNSPAKNANLIVGDVILSINNKEINNASDIENNVKSNFKHSVLIKRQDETLNLNVSPVEDVNGNFKLGIFIRDNVCGIGTITFIKNGRFASLGHPILNDTGALLEIKDGDLFPCHITGCVKGEKGVAGELRGVFIKNKPFGYIDKNLQNGVYGYLSDDFDFESLEKIEIGTAVPGEATIISTVNGDIKKEYTISIIKVDNLSETKNMVIKITDKSLIDASGGIVQGMSGSPIIQSGKLVGAVTHVFLNDSTRGFGIDIANMLNN